MEDKPRYSRTSDILELLVMMRAKVRGFSGGFMNEIINFTPEELANLETIKKYREENGFEDKERISERIINKIRALGINTLHRRNRKIFMSFSYKKP